MFHTLFCLLINIFEKLKMQEGDVGIQVKFLCLICHCPIYTEKNCVIVYFNPDTQDHFFLTHPNVVSCFKKSS